MGHVKGGTNTPPLPHLITSRGFPSLPTIITGIRGPVDSAADSAGAGAGLSQSTAGIPPGLSMAGCGKRTLAKFIL